MSRALFQIDQDLIALDLLVEERGGELSDPEAERAWDQWANELFAERAEKLDRIAEYLAQQAMEASAAREQAERYLMAAKVRERRIEDRKRRVLEGMQARGLARLESATGRVFAVQRNGGKRPIEMDPVDVASLPADLLKTVTVPDTEAVRAHLEAGATLHFARLLPSGFHLRVR